MKQSIVVKPALFNIVFLLLAVDGFSQIFPEFNFRRLTENDGLSNTNVNCVTQDGDGIIWVSTENGLNRFDGYGFTKFYSNPYDSTSINANEITNIYSDQHDHLWISTASGICCFNTITQKARQFRTGTNVPSPFRVYDGSIAWFDKGNSLPYIVSSIALYQFTSENHYRKIETAFQPFSYKNFSIDSYQKIVEDKKGQLWAFRQNRIFKINNNSKKVEAVFAYRDPNIGIYDIIFDRFNRCWVSTWENGLYIFDPDQRSWSKFLSPPQNHTVIKGAAEWNWNDRTYLLFPTSTPAILCIDEETLQSRYYAITGPDVDIKTPFIDRQNNLWVPTSDGLYYFSPSIRAFELIPVMTAGPVSGKDVRTMNVVYNMREEKESYWISLRYNGGIEQVSKDWHPERYWPDLVNRLDTAIDDRLASTREGFDFRQVNEILFVTTDWGMMTLNLKNGERRIYHCPWTENIMRLRTIVPEGDDKWWIRSFDQGVFVFSPITCQFIRHYDVGKKYNDGELPNVNYLLRDRKGRVFVTTNAGLHQYNSNRDAFLRVRTKGDLKFGNSMMGMAEDKEGILWIGTDNGLIAFNADSGRIVKTFTENNRIGLVQRIAIDSSQNVWFNSVGGYWCWLRKRDRIIQFKYSEGLPFNDGGMFYTASDRSVYAGGNGTVVKFFPDRLMEYENLARAKIMDVLVNDKLFPVVSYQGTNKEVQLSPTENNLQVHFDVTNYEKWENNLFYYKLDPGQPAWNEVENGKLSFINLSPGSYKLSVRGGNKLTGMFTNIDELDFTIQPHWYQRWEFLLLCALFISGIAYMGVRRRIATIRKQATLRQKIAETEMMALRSQMNPHFIFNSLNGIEYYILQNEKRNASVYLNKFASLIRIILSHSRKDVVPFLEDMESIRLYTDLELLRFNHNFQFITDIDQELMDNDYHVPPLLIQPFVENSIIHGFAYSERKDLKLKITALLRGEYIVYTIEDNGVGRDRSAALNRINKPQHSSLGMKITRQRIALFNEQHHGQGSVDIEDLYDENQMSTGTRVTISIKSI